VEELNIKILKNNHKKKKKNKNKKLENVSNFFSGYKRWAVDHPPGHPCNKSIA